MTHPCVDCPMLFDPSKADQPATDRRGGVFTGWSLPDGERPPGPAHEHEVATCPRCGNYADAEDGTFCSSYCRDRDLKECGE